MGNSLRKLGGLHSYRQLTVLSWLFASQFPKFCSGREEKTKSVAPSRTVLGSVYSQNFTKAKHAVVPMIPVNKATAHRAVPQLLEITKHLPPDIWPPGAVTSAVLQMSFNSITGNTPPGEQHSRGHSSQAVKQCLHSKPLRTCQRVLCRMRTSDAVTRTT